MAEGQSKIDAAAEKAFADAAQKKADDVNVKAVEKAVSADETAAVKPSAIAEAVAAEPAQADSKASAPAAKAEAEKAEPAKAAAEKAPAKKAVANKAAAKKAPAKKRTPKKAAGSKPAEKTTKKAAARNTARPSVTQLKEKIMATAKNTKTDYTATAKDMAAQMQTRAKAAFEKGGEMTSQVTDFHKANIEALVESGKILASGMQDMGRTYVEEAKTAADTVQDDVKKMAAIKSPTEFFQLQGEIARRNFDAMVATTSKNTEMMMKLVNEAFAPISSRASVATEKFSKAA
jgi:phasin family protein